MQHLGARGQPRKRAGGGCERCTNATIAEPLLTPMFRGYSMPGPYAMPMRMLVNPVLVACLASLALTSPAVARPFDAAQDDGQRAARERRLRGQNLPAREIERRIIPRMPGAQYLGFDYDPEHDVYTLKFLRNGSVIWIEVDGHTGQILRRMGN